MRKTIRGIVSSLCALAFLASCAGTPETPGEKINPVAQSVSESSAPAADEAQATEAAPAEADDAVPALPAPERIIGFYPEPEVTAVLPAPAPEPVPGKVASPAQTEKSVPATPAATPAAAVAAKPELANETPKKTVQEKTDEPESEPSGGIWESEPVAPVLAPSVQPVPANSPSRSVTLAPGQTLEVWYPGSGWVYLGDGSAQNGLAYETRKLDKSDTLFAFRALKEGNYLLNFSRYDVLKDDYAQDSLAVSVVTDPARSAPKRERVRAPDYRLAESGASAAAETPEMAAPPETPPETAALPETPASSGSGASGAGTGAVQTPAPAKADAGSGSIRDEPSLLARPAAAPAPQAIAANGRAPIPGTPAAPSVATDGNPASLLAKARDALASGDPATALSALDAFFARAIDSLDEGWYLRGQAFEANGPTRDIRKALGAYETLVSAYPESTRWKDADARIRYIRQFYQRIR